MSEFKDDGPGIPPEDIPMLFDPFYTTKQKGTGLGLYISQKILAEHRGCIEVDATLEVGTAFVISLPCSVNFNAALRVGHNRKPATSAQATLTRKPLKYKQRYLPARKVKRI